jgi:hypothetical protein
MGQFLSACVRPEPVSACSSRHTYADPEVDAQATQIVDILLAAEKPGAELAAELEDVVHAASWTEYLAAAVVRALCVAIEVGVWLGNAAADAFRRAIEEAYEFGRDHPELVVILALAKVEETRNAHPPPHARVRSTCSPGRPHLLLPRFTFVHSVCAERCVGGIRTDLRKQKLKICLIRVFRFLTKVRQMHDLFAQA